MRPSERAAIVSELSWLHDDPKRVAQLLTADEEREIIKRGFVPSNVWAELKKRLKNTS